MRIETISISNIKGIKPMSIKLNNGTNIVKGKGKSIFFDTITSLLTKGVKDSISHKSKILLRLYFDEEDDIEEDLKPYTVIYMKGNKVLMNDIEVDNVGLSLHYYPNSRVYSCDWDEIKERLIRYEYLYLLSVKHGWKHSHYFPTLEKHLNYFYPDMKLIGVNSTSRTSFLINNKGYEYEITNLSMEEKSLLYLLIESLYWHNSTVFIDDIELNLSSNTLSKLIDLLPQICPNTQFIISTKSDIPSIPYINLNNMGLLSDI